jgi:hypothetical protein
MPRRVFFSFHYDRDIFRASIVRNSGLTKDWEEDTPVDKAEWESIKRPGDAAVYRWIDRQLSGCGVTCILVGAETASRKFCMYEAQKSHDLGKGIVAVRIHGLTCARTKTTDYWGTNPLDQLTFTRQNTLIGIPLTYKFSELYKTYDYVADDGYNNLKKWIEEAAKNAGR